MSRHKGSIYAVYGFKLGVLTNNIPFRITSQLGLVYILLKVLLSCVSLKTVLYVLGFCFQCPRSDMQIKHSISVCSPGERFLLGKYSSKSPVHQNTYSDVQSFVISPPLPKGKVHLLH